MSTIPYPRLAVIGAGGQVGRQIVVEARSTGGEVWPFERNAADPTLKMNLVDPVSIRRGLRAASPALVILAAAATNVAWCEADPQASWAINVEGARAVALEAAIIGARLIFISTDYVFDGTAGPYDEHAIPVPINHYGRQKLAGEEIVLAASSGNVVVRTCQVFGPDPRRQNYVLRTADELRRGRVIAAAIDLFGTPTFGPDLARSVLAIGSSGAVGVLHVAGDAFLSRFDLACRIAAAFGCDTALVARESFAQTRDMVPRPTRSGLIMGRQLAPPLIVTPLDRALRDLAAMETA